MLLGKLIKNIKPAYKSIKFNNIRFNSKDCKNNDVFFSIQGNKFNGNNYIKDAIKNGSKIIISNLNFEGFNKKKILFIRNKNPRKALAEAASNFYKKKPKNIIALTGTNGKTSISNFFYQILSLNKKKVAAIGTLGVLSKKIKLKTNNTTIDPIKMHQILQKLKNSNIDNVIIEASSHGLKQHRLDGLNLKTALFMNHPYRRPIIGWKHEIKALTVNDLRAFYEKWYTPSNAVLVVAGDITLEKLKPMADRTYGKIPASKAIQKERPSEPPQKASRLVILKDERVRQGSYSRTFIAPSRVTSVSDGPGKEHSYALEILSAVIGEGPTSQIYRSLVVDQKIAVSAGTFYSSDPQGPSRFTFYATPSSGVSMKAIEQALEKEIAFLLSDGVTKKDITRVKKSLLAQAIYARDSFSAGAMSIGMAIASGKKISDVESWPHRISDVTVDQVNSAARAVFENRPSVTAILEELDKK